MGSWCKQKILKNLGSVQTHKWSRFIQRRRWRRNGCRYGRRNDGNVFLNVRGNGWKRWWKRWSWHDGYIINDDERRLWYGRRFWWWRTLYGRGGSNDDDDGWYGRHGWYGRNACWYDGWYGRYGWYACWYDGWYDGWYGRWYVHGRGWRWGRWGGSFYDGNDDGRYGWYACWYACWYDGWYDGYACWYGWWPRQA